VTADTSRSENLIKYPLICSVSYFNLEGLSQARRQDLAAKEAKNQKEGHIFKIWYWTYAATEGPNVKWGGTDFKWEGRAPLASPLATALGSAHQCSQWRRDWF